MITDIIVIVIIAALSATSFVVWRTRQYGALHRWRFAYDDKCGELRSVLKELGEQLTRIGNAIDHGGYQPEDPLPFKASKELRDQLTICLSIYNEAVKTFDTISHDRTVLMTEPQVRIWHGIWPFTYRHLYYRLDVLTQLIMELRNALNKLVATYNHIQRVPTVVARRYNDWRTTVENALAEAQMLADGGLIGQEFDEVYTTVRYHQVLLAGLPALISSPSITTIDRSQRLEILDAWQILNTVAQNMHELPARLRQWSEKVQELRVNMATIAQVLSLANEARRAMPELLDIHEIDSSLSACLKQQEKLASDCATPHGANLASLAQNARKVIADIEQLTNQLERIRKEAKNLQEELAANRSKLDKTKQLMDQVAALKSLAIVWGSSQLTHTTLLHEWERIAVPASQHRTPQGVVYDLSAIRALVDPIEKWCKSVEDLLQKHTQVCEVFSQPLYQDSLEDWLLQVWRPYKRSTRYRGSSWRLIAESKEVDRTVITEITQLISDVNQLFDSASAALAQREALAARCRQAQIPEALIPELNRDLHAFNDHFVQLESERHRLDNVLDDLHKRELDAAERLDQSVTAVDEQLNIAVATIEHLGKTESYPVEWEDLLDKLTGLRVRWEQAKTIGDDPILPQINYHIQLTNALNDQTARIYDEVSDTKRMHEILLTKLNTMELIELPTWFRPFDQLYNNAQQFPKGNWDKTTDVITISDDATALSNDLRLFYRQHLPNREVTPQVLRDIAKQVDDLHMRFLTLNKLLKSGQDQLVQLLNTRERLLGRITEAITALRTLRDRIRMVNSSYEQQIIAYIEDLTHDRDELHNTPGVLAQRQQHIDARLAECEVAMQDMLKELRQQVNRKREALQEFRERIGAANQRLGSDLQQLLSDNGLTLSRALQAEVQEIAEGQIETDIFAERVNTIQMTALHEPFARLVDAFKTADIALARFSFLQELLQFVEIYIQVRVVIASQKKQIAAPWPPVEAHLNDIEIEFGKLQRSLSSILASNKPLAEVEGQIKSKWSTLETLNDQTTRVGLAIVAQKQEISRIERQIQQRENALEKLAAQLQDQNRAEHIKQQVNTLRNRREALPKQSENMRLRHEYALRSLNQILEDTIEYIDNLTNKRTRGSTAGITKAARDEAGQIKRRWALLIGINKYSILQGYSPLKFCDEDVKRLGAKLKSLGYTVVQIHDGTEADFNRKPIIADIERDINNLIENLKDNPDDLLWVHFSGHGDIIQGEPVLVTYDTNKRNSQSGIRLDDLQRILRESGVKRIILTIDACHVGQKFIFRFRGDSTDSGFIKNVYEKATGFAIIAASSQRAIESEELGMGVFTHYLLDALEQHKGYRERRELVTLQDVYTHLKNSLQEWSVVNGIPIDAPRSLSEGSTTFILADYRTVQTQTKQI